MAGVTVTVTPAVGVMSPTNSWLRIDTGFGVSEKTWLAMPPTPGFTWLLTNANAPIGSVTEKVTVLGRSCETVDAGNVQVPSRLAVAVKVCWMGELGCPGD